MPIAFEEFRTTLAQKLSEASDYLPDGHSIEKDYEAYLALVEMMGEDGTIDLCREADGGIIVSFQPQPNP